jgi:hypothetical protein
MRSLDEFKAAVRSIVEESGQSTFHLAALGSLVRPKLPDFSPANYGYSSFTELLESCSDLGEIRFGEKPEDRWFAFGSVGAEDRITNHEITKPVWDACVEIDDSRQAWLDFANFSNIETNPEVVAEEPERYVELPRFGRVRQLALLR